MGWKTFKEKFGIAHHVQVTEKGLCIGSGYVSDLVTVDLKRGELYENPTFGGFLREKYPTLLEAAPKDIVAAIETPDTFTTSIAVYTYLDGKIVEKRCEVPGWPNVTHDGCMMYENTFSTDKAKVVAWAKHSCAIAIERTRDRIADVELELTNLKTRLLEYEAEQALLAVAYPDLEPSA